MTNHLYNIIEEEKHLEETTEAPTLFKRFTSVELLQTSLSQQRHFRCKPHILNASAMKAMGVFTVFRTFGRVASRSNKGGPSEKTSAKAHQQFHYHIVPTVSRYIQVFSTSATNSQNRAARAMDDNDWHTRSQS